MMQVRATVTMEDEYDTVPKLSNGAISNDFEQPFNPLFKVTPLFDAAYLRNDTRYRHGLTHALQNTVISNDLE